MSIPPGEYRPPLHPVHAEDPLAPTTIVAGAVPSPALTKRKNCEGGQPLHDTEPAGDQPPGGHALQFAPNGANVPGGQGTHAPARHTVPATH